MLKKFSLVSLLIMVLLLAGCSNEKGNNLHIGVEGSEVNQLTLVNNLYKGLFEVVDDSKVVPVLAESFSYSEDGKTMFIDIKEGFTWSDGSAITAENIVTGLKNNIINNQGKYTYQYKYLNPKVEENIRINENNQVEIHLIRGFTDFEKVLAMPIFYPVLNAENLLVGPFSGDFVVEKNSKNRIVLVPRDLDAAIADKKTESIVFDFSLEKEKMIKGFQDKNYDIILPETEIEIKELKGAKIKAPALELLWLNGRSEELKNLEARKAIYQNLEKMPGIYPNIYRGDNKFEELTLEGDYSFIDTNLTLLVLEEAENVKKAEKIQELLEKKMNLNIEIASKTVEEFYTELRQGNFDLALETWEGDYHGKNAYFEVFRNPLYNPLNVSGINIPEINNLQNQVNQIPDSPEREVVFNQLEKKIIESVSAVILSEGIEKESYIQRVKNVGINTIYNYHDYSNIKY